MGVGERKGERKGEGMGVGVEDGRWIGSGREM